MLSQAIVPQNRKPFELQVYKKNNDKAFQFLKRDLSWFCNVWGEHFYPVLVEDDYGIDVHVFASEGAYLNGHDPVAMIELEIKEQKCCKKWNTAGAFFPYKTVNFLYRKFHLIYQKAMPFWVCYNFNGTNCVSFCLEDLMGMPIAFNSSENEDPIFPVPTKMITQGTQNLTFLMDRTMTAHLGLDQPYDAVALYKNAEEAYKGANQIFRKIHRVDDPIVMSAHAEMVGKMQRRELFTGITSFL